MKNQKIIQQIRDFTLNQLSEAGRKGFVVGISGGLDSAVCMSLCASARISVSGVFLPHLESHYGAARMLKDMCDALDTAFLQYDLSKAVREFACATGCKDPMLLGNFAARLRTAYLYHIAAENGSLVINTANRSEVLTGYCTKWGDQAGDISPIGHLYKSEIRSIAGALDIPADIIFAEPTAGFFPGQSDEKEMGISYEDLDVILMKYDSEGLKGDLSETEQKVLSMIKGSEHKRRFPPVPGRLSEEGLR